jgi:RNA polymerase sigma-70 factor (ECF subfamily)
MNGPNHPDQNPPPEGHPAPRGQNRGNSPENSKATDTKAEESAVKLNTNNADMDTGDSPPTDSALLIGLIKQYHRPLYAYAFRLCGQQSDAEDLVQQTFLVAQTSLGQLRDTSKARAWLYSVLRNHFRALCRKQRPISAENAEIELDAIATETSESDVDGEQLQQALANLPEQFRIVVLMYYFEELSYKEISEALDQPVGTVMSQLSRAKQKLRALLPDSTTEPLAKPHTQSNSSANRAAK